jgi:hypothetical protein
MSPKIDKDLFIPYNCFDFKYKAVQAKCPVAFGRYIRNDGQRICALFGSKYMCFDKDLFRGSLSACNKHELLGTPSVTF